MFPPKGGNIRAAIYFTAGFLADGAAKDQAVAAVPQAGEEDSAAEGFPVPVPVFPAPVLVPVQAEAEPVAAGKIDTLARYAKLRRRNEKCFYHIISFGPDDRIILRRKE